ncbi:MAG: hypothetical protein IIW56_09225, partial [Oscillospiraceae bacterium]|nr:hypothetical protein [Oscillospiraceae bacterium]
LPPAGTPLQSLIRLFQFALPRGELENPPSPRGRLWCAKQQFTPSNTVYKICIDFLTILWHNIPKESLMV